MASAFLSRTYPGAVPSSLSLLRVDEPGPPLRYRVVACRAYGSDALGAILSGTDPLPHDRHTQLDSPRWDDCGERGASFFFFFAPCDLSQAFNVGWKCAESRVRSRKRRLSEKGIDTRTSRTDELRGIHPLRRSIRHKIVSDDCENPSRKKRIIFILSY